jgi:DNA-binding MarR family transcriptional regulator
MSRWFRVHDDLVDDPKVQLLSGDLVKALLNLWCLASQNDGVLPAMTAMAFKLRMKPQQVAVVIAELSNAGLIDREGDEYRPHNWDKRQYKSDTDKTAADRAKRYRDKNRDRHASVTRDADRDDNALRERPETEADTEQKQITSLREVSAPAKRGTRLPDDWSPSADDWRDASEKLGQQGSVFELSKFRDHWKAQPGQRGVKLDWNATFRNWMRNARIPTNGQRTGNTRTTGHDAILAAATREARKIVGDGDMAGSADEAEFPIGPGPDGAAARGRPGSFGATSAGNDGRKPFGVSVVEGEVIAPDQADAGLSRGWRVVG